MIRCDSMRWLNAHSTLPTEPLYTMAHNLQHYIRKWNGVCCCVITIDALWEVNSELWVLLFIYNMEVQTADFRNSAHRFASTLIDTRFQIKCHRLLKVERSNPFAALLPQAIYSHTQRPLRDFALNVYRFVATILSHFAHAKCEIRDKLTANNLHIRL